MNTNLKPERSTIVRQRTNSGTPEATLGDESQRSGSRRQVPPVNGKAVPDAEMLLIGALLDCQPKTVAAVLGSVRDGDLADPFHRRLFQAIAEAAAVSEAGVPAVSRRLLQSGAYGTEHGKPIQRRLIDAATCGADGLAVWSFAADVVELAQLRSLDGLCEVGQAAAALPTGARLRHVTEYVDGLAGMGTRLTELRRRSGGTAA